MYLWKTTKHTKSHPRVNSYIFVESHRHVIVDTDKAVVSDMKGR